MDLNTVKLKIQDTIRAKGPAFLIGLLLGAGAAKVALDIELHYGQLELSSKLRPLQEHGSATSHYETKKLLMETCRNSLREYEREHPIRLGISSSPKEITKKREDIITHFCIAKILVHGDT